MEMHDGGKANEELGRRNDESPESPSPYLESPESPSPDLELLESSSSSHDSRSPPPPPLIPLNRIDYESPSPPPPPPPSWLQWRDLLEENRELRSRNTIYMGDLALRLKIEALEETTKHYKNVIDNTVAWIDQYKAKMQGLEKLEKMMDWMLKENPSAHI
jgi:hypothetical protein